MIIDKHVRRLGSDYAKALMSLYPRGLAWNRASTSVLSKMVNGLAEVYGYVDGRAADLLETETDPRITNEMLLDWERNWALPDDCIPAINLLTQQQRRTNLITKMTLMGGQSRAFFTALAATVGENIQIREYAPYMCGVSRTGDTRPLTGAVWDFRWQIGAPETRFYWRVNINHVLSGGECILNRYRPAHTVLVITYVSTLDRSVSMYPYLGV